MVKQKCERKTEKIMNVKNDVKVKAEKPIEARPGDGIRSMRSTYAFRMINYELYAKPSEFEIS